MTSYRLLAVVACVSAAGCAAIPGAIYDDALCQDGGCQNPSTDGGAMTDALIGNAFDAAADAPAFAPSRGTLCATTPCNPDTALSCVSTSDAGVTVPDAGLEACHVASGESSVCGPAGTRGELESCNSSADCAPGYECTGEGTCHRYCCMDTTCADLTQSSTTGTQYFCDVDHEKANPTVTVPVCFVVQHCQPLSGAVCGMGRSCTLVEVNNGMELQLVATCDLTGTGGLGDSCETEQCADGFACIGAIGSRTCQQLCDNYHPCGGSLVCNTKSSGSYSVGICQ